MSLSLLNQIFLCNTLVNTINLQNNPFKEMIKILTCNITKFLNEFNEIGSAVQFLDCVTTDQGFVQVTPSARDVIVYSLQAEAKPTSEVFSYSGMGTRITYNYFINIYMKKKLNCFS